MKKTQFAGFSFPRKKATIPAVGATIAERKDAIKHAYAAEARNAADKVDVSIYDGGKNRRIWVDESVAYWGDLEGFNTISPALWFLPSGKVVAGYHENETGYTVFKRQDLFNEEVGGLGYRAEKTLSVAYHAAKSAAEYAANEALWDEEQQREAKRDAQENSIRALATSNNLVDWSCPVGGVKRLESTLKSGTQEDIVDAWQGIVDHAWSTNDKGELLTFQECDSYDSETEYFVNNQQLTGVRDVFLPFNGFYNSEIGSAPEEAYTFALECFGDGVVTEPDYPSIYAECGKRWAAFICEKLGIPENAIHWDHYHLLHPREYNFHNDRIMIKIDVVELAKIYAKLNKNQWVKALDESLKPRSGFLPFYPHKMEDLPRFDAWDANILGLMLDAFVNQEHESMTALELELLDRGGLRETIENMVNV